VKALDLGNLMDDIYVNTWAPGELAISMLNMDRVLVKLGLASKIQSKVKLNRIHRIDEIIVGMYDKFGG
jgi:hypothetical protein